MLQKCKKKIIFSDEADFVLGGYVNKQNCRIWGTDTLKIQRTQNESMFGADFVPEPIWSRQFFFENEPEETVSVNGDRYRAMLNEFLFTKIEGEDIGNI